MLRLASDRRRRQRDDGLRHDDAGGDQDRRPLARPGRDHARHQRKHRGVGELQQQDAAGKDQQRTLAHQTEDAGRFGVGHLARHRTVRPRRIDFALADARQRKQGRNRQDEGDEKHRAARQQIAAGAHHGRGDTVSERRKAGIAPEPLADRQRSDQTEADRGDRRTEHAAGGGMQRRGRHHHRKDRPRRIGERADADRRDRKARHQPFGAGRIDDRSAGHLPDQSDDAADRQHKTDLDLGPFLRRQIDRNERTESGLHIREKEDEPVETAQALARGSWCRLRRYRF